MTVRFYSSIAQPTTLALNLTAASTTVEVTASVGYPASTPFVVAVDYGTSLEELVQVDNASGTTWTVTRGIGGTSAQDHSSGAAVRHVAYGQDFADSRTHENSTAGVHGVTGDIVGTTSTQTLTNKTLDAPTIDSGTLNAPDTFGLEARSNGPSVSPLRVISHNSPNVGVHSIDVFGEGGVGNMHVTKDGQVHATVNNGSPGLTLQPAAAADPNEDALTVSNEAFDVTTAIGVDGRVTLLPSEDSGGIYIFPSSPTWAGLPFYYERNSVTIAIMNGDGDLTINGDFTAANFTSGAWTSWTPTWAASGGGFAVGDGTVTGRYAVHGKQVTVQAGITRGTTTSFGTGSVQCDLPFNARHTGGESWVFSASMYNAAGNEPFAGTAVAFDIGGGTSRIEIGSYKAGVAGRVSGSAANPFTWAGNTGASIVFTGTYEMA